MKLQNTTDMLMLELLRCVLNGSKIPRDRLLLIDSDALCRTAERHMVAALVSEALTPYLGDRELFDEAQAKQWKNMKSNNVRRTLMFQGERQKLCAFFEKQGIWYMPLKGSILQELYPAYGLREMVDVDMLVDGTRMEEIHDFMLRSGYTAKEYNISKHDVYEKPPMYEFELHRYLISKHFTNHYAYYENIRQRLVRQGNTMEYRFTDNDFYVCLAGYIQRDLFAGGVALKLLMDLYVLRHKVPLDRAYIDAELQKLGATETEALAASLAEEIFGGTQPVAETDFDETHYEMLNDILISGSSKTYEKYIENKLKAKGGSKLKYAVSRLHLPPERVKAMYPYFYEHKAARPFLIFYRLYAAATFKRQKVKNELNTIHRKS
ncbi:MAG: nucleotidyltransferase family protein [Ruminococcus sp.]|nr:nucleotidyltransferase family protein [Ruminococcus sp.]